MDKVPYLAGDSVSPSVPSSVGTFQHWPGFPFASRIPEAKTTIPATCIQAVVEAYPIDVGRGNVRHLRYRVAFGESDAATAFLHENAVTLFPRQLDC